MQGVVLHKSVQVCSGDTILIVLPEQVTAFSEPAAITHPNPLCIGGLDEGPQDRREFVSSFSNKPNALALLVRCPGQLLYHHT